MTVGFHAANLLDRWLNSGVANTAFTPPTNTYVKLHIGDPGAAGAGNVSSVTTRVVLSWAAAASGSKAIQATLPSWATWAGTNGELVSHISVWDNLTAGNFLFSVALTLAKTVNTGDTLNLTSLTYAITPVAA